MRRLLEKARQASAGEGGAHNRFAGKCTNCGATNPSSPNPKCAYCNNPLPHDPENCTCTPCSERREDMADLDVADRALETQDKMKRLKAARDRDGVQSLNDKNCQQCNGNNPISAQFCASCGTRL